MAADPQDPVVALPPCITTRPRRVRWWQAPFSVETWRRTLYALVALPVDLIALPLAIVGRSLAVSGYQHRLACRLLALRVGERPVRAVDAQVIGHTLLSLPLDAVAFALVAYLWTQGTLGNLAYPLELALLGERLNPVPDGTWGGPSLAGAWAVHAAAGVVILFVAPWLIKGITQAQGWLLQHPIGTR